MGRGRAIYDKLSGLIIIVFEFNNIKANWPVRVNIPQLLTANVVIEGGLDLWILFYIIRSHNGRRP